MGMRMMSVTIVYTNVFAMAVMNCGLSKIAW